MSEKFVSRRQKNRQNAIILGLILVVTLGFGARFYQQNKDSDHVSQQALAQIVETQGAFRVKRDNKQLSVDTDFRILAGDRIQTRPEGGLEIEFLDGTARMTLSGGTIVIFENPESGKKFRLQSGHLTLRVSDLPDQGPVKVESNNAEASVRQPGQYVFHYQGMETSFEVRSGRLNVRRIRDGFETTLSSGDTFCCQPEQGAARIEFQEMDL